MVTREQTTSQWRYYLDSMAELSNQTDGMAETDVPQIGHIQQDNLKVTEPIEHEWPEGTSYHINSRRLKM